MSRIVSSLNANRADCPASTTSQAQGELRAAAERDAVDRGDHRHGTQLDGMEGVEHPAQVRAHLAHVAVHRLERGDVPAGGERAARTGEDDRARVVVHPEAAHDVGELGEELLVHRVVLFRPRHRQDGDTRRGLGAGQPLHQASGGGNCGLRFSRKACAPSAMSGLPIDCTSMPSPVVKESRAAFHQTFELTFAISR